MLYYPQHRTIFKQKEPSCKKKLSNFSKTLINKLGYPQYKSWNYFQAEETKLSEKVVRLHELDLKYFSKKK